jgi:hypothetical protein
VLKLATSLKVRGEMIMTENQEKFIYILSKYGDMTAEECCKKLKLEISNDYNTYYSELCFFLPYPNEEDEFDNKIHLISSFSLNEDPLNERAVFSLTAEGKRYVEEAVNTKKANRHNAYQSIIATIAAILALIGVIVAIISLR